MASTVAMFTGLSGLNANARNIDVVGNNIANVNTTAFKSSRLNFSTMFSRTLREGSAPNSDTGGTNPYQIGLGVMTAGTQRNMSAGAISPTGDPYDLAIDGDGFFVVRRAGDTRAYTRAGGFTPDRDGILTNASGDRLQGYGVDTDFNLQTGAVTDVTVPIGRMTIAQATTNVALSGNLNASGTLPTTGTRIDLRATQSLGFSAIAGASPPPTPPNRVESATRLVDIEDPLLPGSGIPLFAAGQAIELRGASKGDKTIPTASLDIDAATTVGDLASFLARALGIDPAAGLNPDGRAPGVTIDPLTGVLSVIGNAGTINGVVIDASDLRLVSPGGGTPRNPFVPDQVSAADGESVRTTVVVFDSLGTPVQVDVSMVLAARNDSGTTWRYYVQSGDDSDVDLAVSTGTITFDTQGQLVGAAQAPITIDRAGTGAVSPLAITLAFSDGASGITSLTDDESSLAAIFRDGSSLGTLTGFGVQRDGTITGSFSNGITRTIGQVILATFANTEGLSDLGDNLFLPGGNSGPEVLTTPGLLGTGQTVGGALELSNVDLGEEFIKLILSSTGYSASSRVIRTADELMQQLMVIGR